MPRAPALLLIALLAVLVCVPTVPASLCDLLYCDCTRTYHPQLLNLNCSLEPHQTIELTEGSVPIETIEVEIHGGREVRLDQHAFSKLLDMQRLLIAGANVVLVRKHAFLNLTVTNLLLVITDADSVHFQSKAFAHIKGPVTASVARCAYMVIEAEVFSWLLQLTISSVPRLELSAGAFVMDTAVQTASRHGPSMKIHFTEVMIPELSGKTFGASAAEIRMERIEVRTVKSDAFLANIFTSVLAINSSFHNVEEGAFAQKAHVVNLHFKNCHIHNVETNAVLSAITNLTIESCRVNEILSGAINITVVNLAFSYNEFEKYHSKGVYLQSWTRLFIKGNSFNDMDSNAIIAPIVPQSSDFSFVDNEMIFLHKDSLKFIGDIMESSKDSTINVQYENNYYAQVCHCNVGKWLGQILGQPLAPDESAAKSFCTVDVFFARCFNVPEGNMLIQQFTDDVCSAKSIQCEPTKVKTEGVTTEIKNTRFPHRNLKNQESGFLSSRDKKIIGLIFLIALCGMVLIIIITGIAWIKRKGYCGNIKNAAISSNTSCMSFFDRLFGFNLGLDNARSISRLSVNEYTERHRLNEPRTLEMDERIPTEYLEEMVPMEDKATQTLPEELTKELLESLREKLDDPENYTEAREMIEHLYELIKVEESCNSNPISHFNERFTDDENVYDVIQVPSSPNVGVGKNKKKMVSIGTKAPSLEKLAPFSPYNRQTALCHEYFEPKDFAVHLYAELASDREVNAPSRLSSMPDVVAEQPVPRGPFLRAMREKMNGNNAKSKNGACLAPTAPVECFDVIPRPYPTSTQRSNKSTSSNASSKMVNRPLPEKPVKLDPGEGTSFQNR